MYDDTFNRAFLAILRRRLQEQEAKFPMQMVRLKTEVLAANAALSLAATDEDRDRAMEREKLAIAALLTVGPTPSAKVTG